MDFYDDDVEFNTPCLLIESSQGNEATILSRMDSEYLYLGHLTSHLQTMNHHASTRSPVRHKQEIKIFSALSETGGGNNNRSTANSSSCTGNTTQNTQQQQQGQAQTSSNRHGGGGGEGGDDGDDRHDYNTPPEPDVCNDSTDHSEESGSSSVPELIPAPGKQPPTVMTGGADGSFSSDSNPSLKLGSSSSNNSSAERTHPSEASTAIADEVYQSRLDTSDEMLPPLKKKSSSSSLGKSKSDTSSSLYPASSTASSLTSSLSSDASPQFHPHLDPVKEDAEQKEQEICSQELFADDNAISSQEVLRISTPQDRSTPVENKQVKGHAQDLYHQVLRSTSTPNHTGQFNCLQFSGSTSQSGGSKIESIHDSYMEAPLLHPSSPTANVSHCAPCTESSSTSSGMVVPTPSSLNLHSTPEQHLPACGSEIYVSTSTSESNIINPSPESFMYRPDKVKSSPEESGFSEKPADKQVQQDENSDDQDVGLPQWQKEIILKEKQKESKASSSAKSSSSSNSNNSADEPENQSDPWHKEWQSVESSNKNESATTSRGQSATVKHVTFLMDNSESQLDHSPPRQDSQENIESLSPSSLVIDDQHKLAKLAEPPTKEKTCSQPDLSEDLFNAATENTQDKHDASLKGNQDISGILYPDDDQEEMPESQFDLHLSQSQTDSQVPQDDVFVKDLPSLREHDADLLTTHGPTSTNTLSSTGHVPLPSRTVGPDNDQVTKKGNKDITNAMYKSMTQLNTGESSHSPSEHDTEPVISSAKCLSANNANQQPLVTNQQPSTSHNTIQQYLLSDNTSKETTALNANTIEQYILSTDVVQKQTNTQQPSTSNTTIQQPIASDNAVPKLTTPLNTNNPSSPTIANQQSVQASSNQQPTTCAVPLLSSELSTESFTTFHFSLPPTKGDVLVSSTCTTPPPIPSWQPPEREASIETTTSDSLPSHQPPQQSLTSSMQRQDSPDSEHIRIVLPFQQPSTSNLIPNTSQSTKLSVFARARSRKNNQPKRKGKGPATRPEDANQGQPLPEKIKNVQDEKPTDPDDYNPFLFSSQDSVACEPLIKRPRTDQTTPGNTTRQDGIKNQSNAYINTTTVRTITTVRTEVKRVISLEITREGSNEVIERIVYEEEDDPFVEQRTDDKVSQEIIVETGNITYVRQPPPPPLPALEEMPRVSPRRKSQEDVIDKPPRKYRARKSKNDHDPPPKKRRRRDDEGPNKKKSNRTELNDDGDDDNNNSDDQTDNDATKQTPPSPLRLDCTGRLTKGTRVYARWADGFYYPGRVIGMASFTKEVFYEVLFDDGDRRKTRPFQIMACETLPIGQPVMAQDPDGYYDPGIIVGQSKQGYDVLKERTHERKQYSKKDIILSEDQMRILVKTNDNSNTTSTEPVSSSDVQTKSRDTSAKDTNSPNSQQTRQLPDNDETPKSTRKTRRRRGGGRHSSVKKSSSDDSVEARPPPKVPKRAKRSIMRKPTRTSPRKQTQQNKNTVSNEQNNNTTTTTGKVSTNDSMFAGFAFLITRCCNQSSDSENELQEFDRAHVVRQLEAGGGVILKDFSEVQNTVADQCFLISNTYCRTVKYLQCLANGIPMVSHMWIHDCTVLNRLQDYNNYLLPAGHSLETEQVVECKTRTQLLRGLNVYLQGDNQFKVTWSSVLTAAGAQVVSKLPNRPARATMLDDDELCNVVIAQSPSLPQSLEYTCELLGIPIVCLEWLFQCLINGYVVDYHGHPKYDYRQVADNNEDI